MFEHTNLKMGITNNYIPIIKKKSKNKVKPLLSLYATSSPCLRHNWVTKV